MRIDNLPLIQCFSDDEKDDAEEMLRDFKALYAPPAGSNPGPVKHDADSIPAPLYFRILHAISMFFLVRRIQRGLGKFEPGSREAYRGILTAMRAQNQFYRALKDLEAYHARLYPKTKCPKGIGRNLIDEVLPLPGHMGPLTSPGADCLPAIKASAQQLAEWAAAEAVLGGCLAMPPVNNGHHGKKHHSRRR